jgi:perosamine synthetase
MDPIRELARPRGIAVVEDAAEAIGARYRGRRTGSLGDCAAFSLFGNKIITTGEGGVVTTDDDDLAARLRLYRGQGMDPARRYWFPVIGYNYRMTNVAAAIGLAQLERIEVHLAARRRVAAAYDAALAPFAERLLLPVTEPWAEPVSWMYTVQLAEGGAAERDAVMAALAAENIETRPVFYPLHTLPPYEAMAGGEHPNALLCAARGINLPTYAGLTDAEVERIAHALGRALGAC